MSVSFGLEERMSMQFLANLLEGADLAFDAIGVTGGMDR